MSDVVRFDCYRVSDVVRFDCYRVSNVVLLGLTVTECMMLDLTVTECLMVLDLTVTECLTVLLDFLENGFGSPHCQECAMMVLRNMCCHAANKPKILANGEYIPSLPTDTRYWPMGSTFLHSQQTKDTGQW